MRYRLRDLVEYGFIRFVAGLANILPHRAGLVLAWGIAGVMYVAAYGRMRRIQRRIRQVFGGERSERWIRRTCWRAWRNLCFNIIEGLRTPSITLDWVNRVGEYRLHLLFENMKDGRGAILAVPHMGNWELAGVAAQLHGAHIVIIARRLRNPLTNAYMSRLRESAGIDAVLREAKTFKGIIPKLKEGKVLAILPDLRAKSEGIRCRFLGAETNIYPGMALFAREANVPIIPAYVIRDGWARHRAFTGDPIRSDPALDKEADLKRMTQYVMDFFDRAVREHPEQYFWFNGRWVLGEER
jgi:Kdo2-lipid IVA lauroyltransferase/acyltransferase